VMRLWSPAERDMLQINFMPKPPPGSEGQLISMSPQDGTVTSTEEAGDDFFLPPVVAGGIMYLLDEKGNLSAWR
ncbi:MAG: hypothetical protein AAF205_13495, partial [Pseudomonadota bacterium]